MECKECIGSKRAVNEIFADGTFTIKDCPACNGTGREVKQMTHEELLAKIDRHMFNGVAFGFINSGKEAFEALRAVVELHKPYQGDKGYTIPLNDCEHCSDGDTPYPCPTVQTIEKELGASD